MGARRHQSEALAVSLFPFLSILACVMGILTLLIAALAIGEISSPQDTVADNEPQTPISTWVDRIAKASGELGLALEERSRLELVHGSLRDLGFAPGTTPEDLERHLQDRERIANLEQANRAKRRESQQIRKSLISLKNEIENLAELPGDAPIEILPAGDGPDLTPYFVEIQSDGVRVLTKEGAWSSLLNLDDLHERGRFKVFLENVRAKGNATTIFLVRPNGVDNFKRAEIISKEIFVRFGKLPIPGSGVIDFKALAKPQQSEKAS